MAQKVRRFVLVFAIGSVFAGLLSAVSLSVSQGQLADYQPQGGDPPVRGRYTTSG
jgi:hypothetical protein